MLVIALLLSCWLLVMGAVVVLCRMAQRADVAAAGERPHTSAPVIALPRRDQSVAQLGGALRRRQAC